MLSGMRITLQLWAISALAIALPGQEKPKDVDGWDKIKWGMTLEEARDAYGVTAPFWENERWTSLVLDPVKIGDMEMSGGADAKHGTHKVSQVGFSLGFDKPGYAGGFDTLKTLLIQKYGPPVSEEKTTGYGHWVKRALWTFPSTSIVLEVEPAFISLQYKATDKKALDKL
jgi:hypothetical protein